MCIFMNTVDNFIHFMSCICAGIYNEHPLPQQANVYWQDNIFIVCLQSTYRVHGEKLTLPFFYCLVHNNVNIVAIVHSL